MSTGNRVMWIDAYNLALDVLTIINPYCDRAEIAGSVRRHKADCGDVEIVAIPHREIDLFLAGVDSERPAYPVRQALSVHFEFLKSGEHMLQYATPLCNLEIYLTTPAQWGVIFTIRSGPAEFSHRLVTPRNQGGMCPSWLQIADGRVKVRKTGVLLDTPEETDVFKVLDKKYIEPEARHA